MARNDGGPGKGDWRRPSVVNDKETAHRWNKSFERKCDPKCPYCQSETNDEG